MKKGHYTIVIFPDTASSLKRIEVPKRWVRLGLYLFLVLFVGVSFSSVYFSKRYIHLLDEQTELTQLRRESKVQRIQVEKFAQRVREFETEMSRLERFEKKLRIITALEDAPEVEKKDWGVGGPYGLTSHSFSTALGRQAMSMVNRLEGDLGHLNTQVKVKTISFQELDEFFKNQRSLLLATPSIWPARGWLTSGFGYRKSPFTGLRERHEGLDIASKTGSSIRATADGLVVVEGRANGYGKLIEIDHGYGLITRYGHNSKHLVKVGDRVKRGQLIARVGSTGRSTGPHLHYEVLLHGVSVNPKNYILED